MKEKIKIIKDNISFSEVPKKFQDNMIYDLAKSMVHSFDEGVYTINTASKDAKTHLKDTVYKYVYYQSSIYGDCVCEIGQEGWRWKKQLAKLLKAYHKKYDAFGNRRKK